MLDYAKKYEDELRVIFNNIAFDMNYKFAFYNSWRDVFNLPNSTYDYNSFISLYKDVIVGFIGYRINRDDYSAYRMQIINFQKNNSYVFGNDAIICGKNIFEKYNMRKINFDVIVGNPVEKTYDKIVKRYGGKIVGIKEQEIRLIDGKFYDLKEYEILADNYFKAKNI
jgi:hypothetical protein